jgi:hypothetical protein
MSLSSILWQFAREGFDERFLATLSVGRHQAQNSMVLLDSKVSGFAVWRI